LLREHVKITALKGTQPASEENNLTGKQ